MTGDYKCDPCYQNETLLLHYESIHSPISYGGETFEIGQSSAKLCHSTFVVLKNPCEKNERWKSATKVWGLKFTLLPILPEIIKMTPLRLQILIWNFHNTFKAQVFSVISPNMALRRSISFPLFTYYIFPLLHNHWSQN